ncbi:Hypothetical protein PACV_154 [Pacmanvirus A23]|uniref:Hypothetical protein n=1 Tax=Pacmanvirus A23 TaxID=1932881 RepID=UPI000A093B13|nr:Hypothetical protein B9W72_gp152 [Pacmanvirus A23]SIP85869.1 Hypothetical protein PACV_154 [Pacmanvirus A23]
MSNCKFCLNNPASDGYNTCIQCRELATKSTTQNNGKKSLSNKTGKICIKCLNFFSKSHASCTKKICRRCTQRKITNSSAPVKVIGKPKSKKITPPAVGPEDYYRIIEKTIQMQKECVENMEKIFQMMRASKKPWFSD